MAMNGGLVVVKTEPCEIEEDLMVSSSQGGDENSPEHHANAHNLTAEEVQEAQKKLRQFQKMGLIEVEIGENDPRLATISTISGTPITTQLLQAKTMDKSSFLLSPRSIEGSTSHLQFQLQKLQQASPSDKQPSTHIVNHNLLDSTANLLSLKTMTPLQAATTMSVIGQNEAEMDIPNLTADSGTFGFEVSLEDREDTMKTPTWLMSKVTHKLYININKPVPFHVRLTQNYPRTNLYVRVMAVFNSHQFLRTIVSRCPNHSNPSDQSNIDCSHPDHVVRVDHPSAQYDKSSTGRLSVVVPLELIPGSHGDASPILVKFMCLNSCVGGINRRPLAIMFTLEHNGQTVGRHVVDVRVCACPARDFKNDELTKGLKRASSAPIEYKLGKKKIKHILPKVKEEDTEVFLLPVRGFQLFSYLKEVKSMYLRHHPEYAEKYPDVEDQFQDKFSEPMNKEWQCQDTKDLLRNNDDHIPVSSPVVNTTNSVKVLLLDKTNSSKLFDGHSILQSESKLKSNNHIKSESELISHKSIKKENSVMRLMNEITTNCLLGDSIPDIPVTTNSNNKITVTKNIFENANSNTRHLPFVSVTPYLPGSTVVQKSKKSSECTNLKKKFAQIHRVNSNKEKPNVSVDAIPDKNCDIAACNKDEMMAIQLLASNMSAGHNDLCEELENASFEDDLIMETATEVKS